jgi:(2R)-sulfolactate sulfo-lyase subunit alpha
VAGVVFFLWQPARRGSECISDLMNNSSLQLLRLHDADNVLTVLSTMEPGDTFQIEQTVLTAGKRLPIGHKVAARAIAAGEKICKYGVPIGSAVCAIAQGEHVHTHNIKSDYLPTFERENQQRFFQPTR